MSNFDLIEDFLAGRLGEDQRKAFEDQLSGDSQLRAEVNLQKHIISGIQKARAAELKAMLSNVPVGGGSTAITMGKIAAVVVTAGIVGSAIYFGVKDDRQETPEVKTEQLSDREEPPVTSTENAESVSDSDAANEPKNDTPAEEPVSKSTETAKPEKKRKVTQPVTPKIEVVDPTEDLTEDSDETQPKQFPKSEVSVPSIEVETSAGDKKHNFHYQFSSDRLILFGPFDENLYEVIEINGDVHSIFLYYNKSYYMLDQSKHEITPLTALTDKSLISKLNEYRNK